MRSVTRNIWKVIYCTVAAVLGLYVVLTYVLLPALWRHYEHQPALANHEMVTRTPAGIPGDPMNIGLIGDQEDVVNAMHAAGWYPADPITLRSSAAIIRSVLFNRSDLTAPVSPLIYDGRHEDLAFELPNGGSVRQRHHVRLWKVLQVGIEDRPVWLGAATFDRGVGLSADTGQFTHLISPDIDAERDFLAGRLEAAHVVEKVYQVSGVAPTFAKNFVRRHCIPTLFDLR